MKKFKVYIKELSKICEVNTLTFLDEGIRCFIKGNDTKNYLIDGVDNVLLQFIGLVDKNGKEIFEGDIMLNGMEKLEIKYNKRTTSYQAYTHYGVNYKINRFSKMEIIGNIYENKDLLIN